MTDRLLTSKKRSFERVPITPANTPTLADYDAALVEIEQLRAALSTAIEGHKVWESVYGSSPTSRAHLSELESALSGDSSAPETPRCNCAEGECHGPDVAQAYGHLCKAECPVETSPDARDAARYRFLRQPGNAIVYAKDRNAWGHNAAGHVRYDTAEQLDQAVDAAMGSVVETGTSGCCRDDPGGGFVCTLPKGHVGQHEAYGTHKNLLQAWPAQKASPKPAMVICNKPTPDGPCLNDAGHDGDCDGIPY